MSEYSIHIINHFMLRGYRGSICVPACTDMQMYEQKDCAKSAKEAYAAACPICISESQLCHADQLEVISCGDESKQYQ